MDKNVIPVAFASDENYAMPLSVAMTSLLENANTNTHYDIYILVDKEFSLETKNKILSIKEKYYNCKIEFIILDYVFGDIKIKTHVSKVGRYRLSLGSLLPNINKCIYLDCDIIVQQDLTKMFNIDIKGYYVAGVKDPYTIVEYGQNHADEIGIEKIDQYINSGVLILNLDKIREDSLEKTFLNLSKRNFTKYVDQDIINIACYNKIKHIDLKYNLQNLLFKVSPNNKITTQNFVNKCFETTEIIESIKNNTIIHYSSPHKPWIVKSVNYSNVWWKYYALSPYNKVAKQSNDNFNIAFICEEKHIKSLSVALVSLLENASVVTGYNIIILSKECYSQANTDLIYSFKDTYNCDITFTKVEDINNDSCEERAKTVSNNLSGIDKCVYLDYNVVVQKDLTELFNFDLENCTIGGVKDIEFNEISNRVLLIDCSKIRKSNLFEVKEIDLKYNLRAAYFQGEKSFNFNQKLKVEADLINSFDKKQLKEAFRENVIFSYTNLVNPLTSDNCSFSYIWWKYFRLSPFSKLKITPKVSAILPVYNVGKYLRECLDSLINQTLKDIEIILVNDGSTDNSLEILKEYAELDTRIIILNQENMGAATARNNGLAIAKGEYLSILDSDDYFELTLFEKAYVNAIENNSDIVVYNYMSFNNESDRFNTINHIFPKINGAFSYKDIPEQIFNTLSHNAWSKMFKADFIKTNNLKFQCVYRTDDVYFTNIALLQAKRISTIDNHLVYYRTGISSQSTSAREPLSFVDAWKEVLSKIKSLGLYSEVEKSFINAMLQSSLYHLSIMKNTDGYKLVHDYIATELETDFQLSKCENGIITPQLYNAYNSIKNKEINVNDNSSLETSKNKMVSIPVAFASDENYAMPLSVTITSMLENANPTTFYDINILINDQFSTETQKIILSLEQKYNNCQIKFVNLKDEFDNIEINREQHFTKETYYRLLLSSALPHLDKCIYLDCDIIVQQDLAELYNLNVEKYYVAGVKAVGLIYYKGSKYAEELGLPNIDQYINAGVLLINLNKIRVDNIESKFIELSSKKTFELVDQDIINIICFNKIKHIKLKYNLPTISFEFSKSNREINSKYLPVCFNKTEIVEAINDNSILHFLSKIKPWNDKNCNCADVWWKYYYMSPFAKDKYDTLNKILSKTKVMLNEITNHSLNFIILKYRLLEDSVKEISKLKITTELAEIRLELGVLLDEILQYLIDKVTLSNIKSNMNVYTPEGFLAFDRNYYTTWDNTELMKGFNLIGYTLANEIKATPHIFLCPPNLDYTYAKELPKLKFEYRNTEKHEEFINNYKQFLLQNYDKMDILVLNGIYDFGMYFLNEYRKLRPDGKVYCALDMNSGWMQRIAWNSPKIQNFANQCDVISTVCTHVRDLLNANPKVNFTCRFFSNAFYNPNQIPANIDTSKKENTILTVSRIGTYQKNNQEMLMGFAKIADKLPDWKLKLVGSIDDEFKPFMDKYFNEYPHLKEQVIFTGPIIDKQELYNEYAKAKIFMLTSVYEGGAPNVYAEALYHGCKFFTSDIDAADDIINRGELGVKYKKGDIDELATKLFDLCSNFDNENIEEHIEKSSVYYQSYYDWNINAKKLAYILFNSTLD